MNWRLQMTNDTVVAIMMLSAIVATIIFIKDIKFNKKQNKKQTKKSC